jgi:arylsulfatase A-like enzyme
MILRLFKLLVAVLLSFTIQAQPPNVIIIYADDIGYGDLSCYQKTSYIATPNCDKLAARGIRFTDSHTTAASCTPSRYSLMTGQYNWRQEGTGILPGNAASIINTQRVTLPKVFKAAGYATGIVGKWHLGLGDKGGPNFNEKITNGPNQVGFDYSYIMAATGDRVPTVYIENSEVVNLSPNDPIHVDYAQKIGKEPTGSENPDLLTMKHHHGHDNTIVNGVGRIGWMEGGKSARWRDEDMGDIFTTKALKFIENNKKEPFFLFFATHDIHVPRVPHQRFQNKSMLGARGDALLQFDWAVGQILDKLDSIGIANNTLIILSSDNGGVVNDGYMDKSAENLGLYKPMGPLRGAKGSLYEGGTRVPFLVSYPKLISPKQSSPALISQVDLLASFAYFLGIDIDKKNANDSQNQWLTLIGKNKVGRASLVEHSNGFAFRTAKWKYIEPNNRNLQVVETTRIETGYSNKPQLYNLALDLSENNNVAEKYPEIVKSMQNQLNKIKK